MLQKQGFFSTLFLYRTQVTLIAKSSNGTEIIVSLIPLNKMQNTRDGLKSIEVGKRVLLQSGIEVDLNLDGRTFYTALNQLFKFNYKVA